MSASLTTIARALGGDVVGSQILAPGPGHSQRDRSMCIRLAAAAPEGFIVHSHAGDDPLECRDHVRAALGWDRPERFSRRDTPPRETIAAGPDRDELARIARAIAIFDEADDPRGTIVEHYLASRRLPLSAPIAGEVLRYHSACPWRDEAAGRTIKVPCMIAPLRSIETGAIVGIHRTRLTQDGRKVDRRMLGRASGAAIMLCPRAEVGDSLAIGEGIETTLSAMHLGLGPAWALGSVGAITSFPVLPNIRTLTLLAETGDGGASAKAIDVVGQRYVATRRNVLVVTPKVEGDLNDVLQGIAA